MKAEIVGDEVHLECLTREHPVVKQIPGAKWNSRQRVWRLPLAWSTMVAATGILGASLELGPLLLAWGTSAAIRQRELTLIQQGDAKGPQAWDENEYVYQRHGTNWIVAADWWLLADEMGTGKTVQTAVALRYLPKPALVIAPNSVKKVWADHLKVWAPDLTVAVVQGTPKKRLEAISSGADVVVINWEALRTLSALSHYPGLKLKRCQEHDGLDPSVTIKACEAHPRPLNEIPWQTVVADEAHRAADPKSKQTRALWKLRDDAPNRGALTGTPIRDTPSDAWALLHFLAPREFPAKGKFEDRYCDHGFNPYSGTWEVRGLNPATADEFHAILGAHMLRRLKAAVLPDLPPKVYAERLCEMAPKQRKAYEQMAEGLIAEVDGGQVVGWNPLTQTTRLLQFAAAYAELDENGDVRLAEPSAKLDVLEEVYEEHGWRPLVVYAPSLQLIQLAKARLDKRGVPYGEVTGAVKLADRDAAIERFQAGDLPVIFVNSAGSEGLTLTRADTMVYLQRPWSMIQNKQSEDRVHRPGQAAEKVTIVDLIVPGTVEERVFERLSD